MLSITFDKFVEPVEAVTVAVRHKSSYVAITAAKIVLNMIKFCFSVFNLQEASLEDDFFGFNV